MSNSSQTSDNNAVTSVGSGSACNSCGQNADPLARFCSGCGHPLGDNCCGFRNDDHARFCGGCGRPRLHDIQAAPSTQALNSDEILAETAAELEDGLQRSHEQHHFDQGELDSLFGMG